MKIGEILLELFAAAIIALGIGAILNCLVFPIAYFFFHDCGSWFCTHHYDVTWTGYFIISGSLWFLFLLIILLGESSDDGTNQRRTRNLRRDDKSTSGLGRETDFYDSDMEGAPGYYGGW